MSSRIVTSLLLLAFAVGAFAQSTTTPPASGRTITVTGEADREVQPDTAIVSLTIDSQATTVADAMTDNSQRVSAAIAAVKALNIAGLTMKTSDFTIQPVYPLETPAATPAPTYLPWPYYPTSPYYPYGSNNRAPALDQGLLYLAPTGIPYDGAGYNPYASTTPYTPTTLDQGLLYLAPTGIPYDGAGYNPYAPTTPYTPTTPVAPTTTATPTQKATSYKVVNALDIRIQRAAPTGTDTMTDDLANAVSKVTDAALKTGADGISVVNFLLTDDTNVQLDLLAEASRKAESTAEALAKGTGVTLGQVISVSNGWSNPSMGPGPLTVSATVSVTYEIK